MRLGECVRNSFCSQFLVALNKNPPKKRCSRQRMSDARVPPESQATHSHEKIVFCVLPLRWCVPACRHIVSYTFLSLQVDKKSRGFHAMRVLAVASALCSCLSI